MPAKDGQGECPIHSGPGRGDGPHRGRGPSDQGVTDKEGGSEKEYGGYRGPTRPDCTRQGCRAGRYGSRVGTGWTVGVPTPGPVSVRRTSPVRPQGPSVPPENGIGVRGYRSQKSGLLGPLTDDTGPHRTPHPAPTVEGVQGGPVVLLLCPPFFVVVNKVLNPLAT